MRHSDPLVVIIIITYNGRHHLARCLPSVMKTDYPAFRVVVVDNASTDGSSEFVSNNYPTVSIVRHSRNLGFAKGNNSAIANSLAEGFDYIFLLNDDTELLEPTWLATAIRLCDGNPRIGMVGFSLTNDSSVSSLSQTLVVRTVDAIEGCALLMRSTMLRNIGLFDEVYFAYAEESDLEMRALRAGYSMMEISIPIYHLGGGTSRRFPVRRTYLVMRNVIRHSIKNRSVLKTLLRGVKTFDIACNPWSFFFDAHDVTHQKIRGNGNVILNFCIFTLAIAWNILFLPQTLFIRYKENKMIEKTKKELVGYEFTA